MLAAKYLCCTTSIPRYLEKWYNLISFPLRIVGANFWHLVHFLFLPLSSSSIDMLFMSWFENDVKHENLSQEWTFPILLHLVTSTTIKWKNTLCKKWKLMTSYFTPSKQQLSHHVTLPCTLASWCTIHQLTECQKIICD